MHSGQGGRRLGKIPLVIGMRVIVTQNFDVDGGVVNGSMGILKRIRYVEDAKGRRYAKSCVVKLDEAVADGMRDMGPSEVPILADEVHFS
ncbi:hypothetical protein CERSUDRAFT_58649, partial [Gelatoporia subvermispora B]